MQQIQKPYQWHEGIVDAFRRYGYEDVRERGLCIICMGLGAGIHKGFITCSPDCADKLDQLIGEAFN